MTIHKIHSDEDPGDAEFQVAARRDHRKCNFWEPTHDGITQLTTRFDWTEFSDAKHANSRKLKGATKKRKVEGKICLGSDLWKSTQDEIANVVFQSCDFFGEFGPIRKLLSVSDCVFSKCSFEDSRWLDVRFRNCQFTDCAFGIVLFDRCVFDKYTKFCRISVSGEFTKFMATTLWAEVFLSAVVSKHRVDVSPKQKGGEQVQADKLPETLRKVAYAILQSTSGCEDPAIRAEAYKAYQKRRWNSVKKDAELRARDRGVAVIVRLIALFFPGIVEFARRIFGWATDWGTSLTRLAMIYAASIAVATIAYGYWMPMPAWFTWWAWPGRLTFGLRAAIEVQLLFGYTNYHEVGTCCRAGMLAHAVFATFLYIALAAMLARESMARNPNA